MERRRRPVGIPVDPDRVREARLAAGLSLGDVAGDDVSRTQIHFIEHGRSRPSRRVLELIAQRTGKPVSYFVLGGALDTRDREAAASFARELSAAATRARRLGSAGRLTRSESEAIRLVEVNLRQAAVLVRALETKLGSAK